MNSLLLGALVFFILILATMLGMFARSRLPEHHLNSESKDVIRLATAVVGTLSALALGLLIASAKSDYDNAQAEMKTSAARIVLLDRIMARYGPETEHPRAVLKQIIQKRLDRAWNAERADELSNGALPEFEDIEDIQDSLRALNPKDTAQGSLQTRALEVSGMIAEGHWQLVETTDEGLPVPFLIVLISWLALLFATFGLQAPLNSTVILIIIVCSLSVAGAIFVISDMASPYAGLIHISETPLRTALDRLGAP